MNTVYGIKNCETMKKARAWLETHGVPYEFHDYKTAGIDRAHLTRWIAAVGWERLLNRGGTTFRKLPTAEREDLSERKAIALMLEHPSLIRRPVLELGARILVGFKPESYASEVKSSARA
jgi:arsenate reductase (glutaredoxin)